MAAKRIDVHNHVIPNSIIDDLAAHPDEYWLRIEGEGANRENGASGRGRYQADHITRVKPRARLRESCCEGRQLVF